MRHTSNITTDGIVEYLIEQGAKVDSKLSDGTTPLHLAAMHRDGDSVFECLLKHGANVGSRGEDGKVPLHLAVENGCSKSVDRLLKHGDPEDLTLYYDDVLSTPLDLARVELNRLREEERAAGDIIKAEETLKLLEDAYCKWPLDSALHSSIKPFKSQLFVLKGDVLKEDVDSDKQVETSRTWQTKPVTEVLFGPNMSSSWLGELRRRQLDPKMDIEENEPTDQASFPNVPTIFTRSRPLRRRGRWLQHHQSRGPAATTSRTSRPPPPGVRPSLSCWIHLPAHNVS